MKDHGVAPGGTADYRTDATTMFGKTRELSDRGAAGDAGDGFFGDEDAAASDALLLEVHDRVKQVELQINSQFTSMAAYAQIAQEQVELARAESRAETERTERRLIELVERERADRVEALDGHTPSASGWNSPDIDNRLDALERSVAEIRDGLADCLARQKALADAITALFEPKLATLPPPASAGPISDLSLA